MPQSIEVDKDGGLVRIVAWGRLAAADFLDGLARITGDPGYRPGMPQLCDFTHVTGADLSADDLRGLVEAFASKREQLGRGRVAIVAPLPVIFGLSRMYQAFSEDSDALIEVFRRADEALAWLRGAADPANSGSSD